MGSDGFNADEFLSDPAHASSGGGGAQAPSVQAPSNTGGGFDATQFLAENPRSPELQKQELISKVGASPMTAIPDSPLSIMERAALGWEKYPEKQKKYLEDKFGKDNVQPVQMDNQSVNYAVKDKDGTWKQVDPAGLSDIPSDIWHGQYAKAWSRVTNFSPKNAVGATAQMAGESGLPIAGAAIGGAAAVGALPVGLGMLATGGALAAGGAAGGALGEMGDLSVRNVLKNIQDATGMQIPGAQAVADTDVKQQLMASMIMGATQELAGPVIKWGADQAVGIFSGAIKRLGTTPEAKANLKSLIMYGTKAEEGLANEYVQAPREVGKYTKIAEKDYIGNDNGPTDVLPKMQTARLETWIDEADGVRKTLGKQYDVIADEAKKAKFNPFEPDSTTGQNALVEASGKLHSEGFIDPEGNVLKTGQDQGQVVRHLSDADASHLKTLMDNFSVMQKQVANGRNISYKEMLIAKQNLGDALFSKESVSNGQLKNVLMKVRDAVDQTMSDGLHAVDPALADEFAKLNSDYHAVAEPLKEIMDGTDGSKLQTFLNRTIKGRDKYQAGLVEALSTRLGIENPTSDILQMEMGKIMRPMFSSTKLPVPFMEKMHVGFPVKQGMEAYGNNIQPLQQAGTDAATKMFGKVHEWYKGLDPELRQTLMKTPDAISTLGGMAIGASQEEKQQHQQLMNQVGALQQHFYGQ